MSGMWRASLVAVLVTLPFASSAQRSPNFSGDWVLVSATTSGTRGRGEAETSKASGQRPTMSNTASGAAFNCGRECTIVHKGQALTIDKALLASNTTAAPAVTLQLDGGQTPVVDSFNPGRKIPATAKWDGDKLQITSPTGARALTQLLSIEAAQLVVVTSAAFEGSSPVTLRYRRK
jgi:hypothetical protein